MFTLCDGDLDFFLRFCRSDTDTFCLDLCTRAILTLDILC